MFSSMHIVYVVQIRRKYVHKCVDNLNVTMDTFYQNSKLYTFIVLYVTKFQSFNKSNSKTQHVGIHNYKLSKFHTHESIKVICCGGICISRSSSSKLEMDSSSSWELEKSSWLYANAINVLESSRLST